MSKTILFALLVITGSTLNAADAFACGARGCFASAAPSCAAPACTAPMPGMNTPEKAAPADPHAGMNMTQAKSSGAYQSFSYEPGSSQPMMSVPVGTAAPAYRSNRQPSSSYYDSVRGDKKIRAFTN